MSVQLQAGGSLRIPMSYADYLALGETRHHEHYDKLTIVNPPNRRHVLIARRLTVLLDGACPVGFEVLPEWGWQPTDMTVFAPDVMVAAADAPGEDLLRAAPLLVIEISSPRPAARTSVASCRPTPTVARRGTGSSIPTPTR